MSDEGVLPGYTVKRSANSFRRQRRRNGNNNMHCACPNTNLDSFEGFISSTTSQAIFAFLDPLLIGVVQVKYQNTNKSPFQARPATMWGFVLAAVIYVFALAASMSGKTKSQLLFGNFAFLAGSLSSVSLVSVLLPSLAGLVIFIMWTFLPVIVARYLIKHAFFWIYGRIKDRICKILRMKDDSMEEQPQLSNV